MTTIAYDAGHEYGYAVGAWVEIDDMTTARRILNGFVFGDPEIMDMCPSPLSGEWAGESIPGLSDDFGIDLWDCEVAAEFEDGFIDGFWVAVTVAAEYQADDSEGS